MLGWTGLALVLLGDSAHGSRQAVGGLSLCVASGGVETDVGRGEPPAGRRQAVGL